MAFAQLALGIGGCPPHEYPKRSRDVNNQIIVSRDGHGTLRLRWVRLQRRGRFSADNRQARGWSSTLGSSKSDVPRIRIATRYAVLPEFPLSQS